MDMYWSDPIKRRKGLRRMRKAAFAAFRYRHASAHLLNARDRHVCIALEWTALLTCMAASIFAGWLGSLGWMLGLLMASAPLTWTLPRIFAWGRIARFDRHYRGALDRLLDGCMYETARRRGTAALERFFTHRNARLAEDSENSMLSSTADY